ncbi:MAG: acetyltransferase [Candidatus Hinthialibacter sp.]
MNQRGQVFLYGSGGHAKVVMDILRLKGAAVAAMLDDDESRMNVDVMGAPVVHPEQALQTLKDQNVLYGIIAIGSNRIRMEKAVLIRSRGYELLTAVHPSAVISDGASIGLGTVVMAGSVVNWDAKIGENVILNTNCTVEHDAWIGDGVHLSPGVNVGGGARIGEGSHIGIGATVLPRVTIGADVIVGGGSVVIKDIPDGATAVGVPARIIKQG